MKRILACAPYSKSQARYIHDTSKQALCYILQNPSAGPGDGWFKVAEAGHISSTEWAMDALINAGGVQSVTIPSCIDDGNYLLRFELIAFAITISANTIDQASDPGVLFNVWNNQGQPYPLTDYLIPGECNSTLQTQPTCSGFTDVA